MILSQLNKEESIKFLEENDNTIYKALQAIKQLYDFWIKKDAWASFFSTMGLQ